MPPRGDRRGAASLRELSTESLKSITLKYCPFCISEENLEIVHDPRSLDGDKRRAGICRCPRCQSEIPPVYVRDYADYPPVICAMLGCTGHGKTAYFASLLHELRGERLLTVWKRFHTLALNDSSLLELQNYLNNVREGIDVEATPKVFTVPTLIRISGVPLLGNYTLCMYDSVDSVSYSGGEMERYAKYLNRARVVLLLVSLSDCDQDGNRPGEALSHQLNAYILGMRNHFQANTKDKHLVVVYSKADQLEKLHLSNWPALQAYLRAEPWRDLAMPQVYFDKLSRVSQELRKLTRQDLRALQFLNTVDEYFASVDFSLVSAWGGPPANGRLKTPVVPWRVLDPLLLVLKKHHLPRQRNS